MLSPSVRLEGFTSTDWSRLLGMFRPRKPSSEARDPSRPRGGVVAVHRRGKLEKLLHTEVGRLRLDEAARAFPCSAAELARAHDASWALVLERRALERLLDGVAARVRRGHDLVDQALVLVDVVQHEMHEGDIELWPGRLGGVPVPTAPMVRGAIDSVCPVGKCVVLGWFDGGELYTSIALRRADRGFDLVLGPDELREDMGLLAGDWHRDYRHLARAVERRAGPLALGAFSEVETFRRLEVDPTPGAWSRAVAVRDVVLSPVTPALAIPLGLDAGLAAISLVKTMLDRVDATALVAPVARGVLDRMIGALPASLDPQAKGFHPLELLRILLSRER